MQEVYVCTGTCGGKVSLEAFTAGKKTCGTVGCTKYGQPFDHRLECEACHAVVRGVDIHEHEG